MAQKSYSISERFTYTGVSRVRIALQLIRYGVLKLLGVRHVVAKVNSYRMKLDLGTPGLSKVLYVYGSRELPDIHVAQSIITEGMHVADIGANIGYYSLLEAQLVGETGHVYAFEPDPRNVPLLRDNVLLNGFEDRITVFEQAVSDKAERKTFQLGERTNVSSFVDRPDVVGAVEVDCIALKDFAHMEKIDMLRMDAEGYECKIIEGALPFLKQNQKPFKIMLEVHPDEYNETDLNFKAVLQELFALGFTVSHLITGAKSVPAFVDRGYASQGQWQETKHKRELFTGIKNEDVKYFLEQRMIRALVISRD